MDLERIRLQEELEFELREYKKIKLEPLKQWYCDQCGEIIKDIESGWVEWLRNIDEEKEHSFRIVHQKSCIYESNRIYKEGYLTRDMQIYRFLGPDGLNNLLEILLRSSVEQEEVLRIIRRLHLPYYEQSLLYRGQANEDQYFPNEWNNYDVIDNLHLIRDYADII